MNTNAGSPPDAARYRELGNAIAVPVASRITARLADADFVRAANADDQGASE